MEATELRIGNWTLCGEVYHKVRQDDFEMSYWIESTLEPIPITHEILQKAGFRKDDAGPTEDYTWFLPVDPDDENNYLSKFTLSDAFVYHYRDDTGLHSIKIEAVHHLQNIYFWLKREELKIEL